NPLAGCEQRRNVIERRIPLGMLPPAVGPQELEVNIPERHEQWTGRPGKFMHDEQATRAQHFPSVSHQKIKVDIFGKVVGNNAVELLLQNDVFGSAMNELDVA